ncbi:hypothetical protein HMI55_003681 [Coelomomyces lativittatus]|nr:hypothetical protein HMI55_003681 [Coelomomyces lativittatus]
MSDMQLMGELAAMCYTLALDTTPPWPLHWANDDGLCIYFKALATQAAGWHPFCYASLTRGFASLFHQDVHVLATFFVACYPTLSSYEKDHGDLGWMLLQWCQLEESAGLSPLMMDVALFFKDLCTHWLSSFHPTKDPETLLGLKLIHVYVFPTRPWDFFFNHELSDSSLNDSETSPFSPLLFNAVRQGACPYHVRLAIQSVPEPSLVTYFITLFKFAYEVPFLSLIQFQLSWRLSDWKLILPPDSAFQACFQFFLNHPSHTALMHPDFPDLGFLDKGLIQSISSSFFRR